MQFESVVDILWTHTWWSFARDRDLPYSTAYHAFNLFEGCVWIMFSGLVLVRRAALGKSDLELWYALAFFTFGLTDFREAYYQQSWLIWLKAVNLGLLIWLRHLVMTKLYPGSKLY
ncbi:MAG: hypothetical protein JWM11_3570 [Planctomycetaceae bacterium]|nr:hypothetical protein [Planctomycetaceae bacterium]